MRRSATLLVQGSYIEESDFQDDVMVYDLVAKKDAQEVAEGGPRRREGPERAETDAHLDLNSEEHSPSPFSLQEQDVPLKPGSLRSATEYDTNNSSSDTQIKGGSDLNANLQNVSAAELGDDLVSQYEDLIRTLGVEAGVGSPTDPEPQSRGAPLEEEEVDFSSFSADTPEPEKIHSPFGSKLRSGSKTHSVPFTGPFVSVLLSRLENMLENSLHVNLLLTGILAQLAAYPQPLLRSFLLNTNLVFQPSVRSLYQVLASLKNQIEQQAASRKDFPELITAAQHSLLARETPPRAEDTCYGDLNTSSSREGGRLLRNSPPSLPKSISLDRSEVFATVLFTEFLKELAAIAQEHSILSYIPTEG